MSSVSSIPEPLAFIAGVMSSFDRWWALCGGWAVDSWLGHVTREHGDLDITVFHDDEQALFEHLAGWHVVAHDEVEPAATDLWTGRPLVLPAHLHGRPPGDENRELLRRWVTTPFSESKDGRDLEFVINDGQAGEWLLSLNPRIAVAADASTRVSPWGLPTVTPEVIAFWKATAYFGHKRLWDRPQDVGDFEALLVLLDDDQRSWLRESIGAIHAEHPWLEKVSQ